MHGYTIEIKGNGRVKTYNIYAINNYKAYITACKLVKLPENNSFSYTNSIHWGGTLVYSCKLGFIRRKNA
jgi:hypothetical protein